MNRTTKLISIAAIPAAFFIALLLLLAVAIALPLSSRTVLDESVLESLQVVLRLERFYEVSQAVNCELFVGGKLQAEIPSLCHCDPDDPISAEDVIILELPEENRFAILIADERTTIHSTPVIPGPSGWTRIAILNNLRLVAFVNPATSVASYEKYYDGITQPSAMDNKRARSLELALKKDTEKLNRMLDRVGWLQAPRTTTDRDLTGLGVFRNLSHIDLSETSITDAGLEHLLDLNTRRLRSLDLAETNISSNALRVIAELPSLTHLNLSHTRVEARQLVQLKSLTSLNSLELEGIPATPLQKKEVACELAAPHLHW